MKYFVRIQAAVVILTISLIGKNAFGNSETWIHSTTPKLGGSFVFVNPSSFGGEFELAYLTALNRNRSFLIGPRLGILWAGGSPGSRFEFQTGLEATLWLMNAIGPGLSVDLVHPRNENVPVHLRLNPSLAFRILRFQESGAWSVRFGLIYDFFYQWGGQLGITLQWRGVPGPGI